MPRDPRNSDERFMAEAIELARRAEGRTRPNPMVGCVIVRDGEVLARGFHERAGAAHGEVAALRQFEGDPEGATLYVNLEPCSHYGRTPPCTTAIVESGVARVVVGVIDPDPRVSGSGLQALEEAGIEVVCGVLEEESRQLNAAYFKRTDTGLPYVVAKWAMSLDGKMASRSGDSSWITSEAAREHTHELRNRYDAIMVGTGTLISDDPRLTCRVAQGRDPVRVVLDATLRAPLDSAVYQADSSTADTLVLAGPEAPRARRETLEERGVEVVITEMSEDGRIRMEPALRELADRELMSVFVEGGGTLLGSLFDEQLVDYVHGFVAPKIIGGERAPGPVRGEGAETMAQSLSLEGVSIRAFGDDILISGRVTYPTSVELP